MFFSRERAKAPATAKGNSQDVKDLEVILENIIGSESLRKTLVESFKGIEKTKERYYNPENAKEYAERHGMLIYTNHNPATSSLLINGFKAKALEETLTVYDQAGKEKLAELMHQDGAIEVDAATGKIKSYHRYVHADPQEVAEKKGRVKNGETVSSETIGLDEEARRKLSGRQDYEGVGTKHHTAFAATGICPDVWMWAFSEESGAIALFHNYEVAFSTIKSEISPSYSQYLSQGATGKKSQSKEDHHNYHRVHEARGSPTLSAEEALRLQLAILHEHKIANHHYI
jgi:hypothetical protein